MTRESSGREERAVAQFVERFGAVLVEAGLPPMAARVFSALLVTDSGALSAADLAAALEASPASISGAVRYLRQLGMISRERAPGSRRDLYRVLDDVWYQTSARQDRVLDHWVSASREGIEVLGADTPAGRRFADSLDFFEFLRVEMPSLLARWREHAANRPGAPPPRARR